MKGGHHLNLDNEQEEEGKDAAEFYSVGGCKN